MRISFLGTGNMGAALIGGAVKAKFLKGPEIQAFDVDIAKLKSLKKQYKIRIFSSAKEALLNSDYVFLCVKPQQMGALLQEIASSLQKKQCLVSIAAGVATESIETAFSFPARVVRVMPNTPALVGAGMSAVAGGRFAKPADVKFIQRFFEAVGEVVILDESHFDAVTAVSGSGPAYLFFLAEALQQAAEKAGLPKSVAEQLTRATLQGAAKLLSKDVEPQELRRRVTSPGGTTEAAVSHLQSQKWPQIFVEAVQKARERSEQLRKRS